MKRLPKKEKTGSLEAWQQCRTPAQGLKVLVQAQLQKGVLPGKRGVPRAVHRTCSHNTREYILTINTVLVFHCQKTQRKWV